MSIRKFSGAALVVGTVIVATATPSWAHVSANPSSTSAGSYARIDFRLPHGCDGAATDTVEIQIPEGVVSLKPLNKAGWSVETEEVETAPYESNGQTLTKRIGVVRWTGGNLPDSQFDDFAISAKFPATPGVTLYFPTVQRCGSASESWVDLPGVDGAEPEHPAPALELVAAAGDNGHGGDHSADSVPPTSAMIDVADNSGEASNDNTSATVIAVVALVVSVCSLAAGAVALIRRR